MLANLPDLEACCHRCQQPRQVFAWIAHENVGSRAAPALLCVRCWSVSSETVHALEEQMALLDHPAGPDEDGAMVLPMADPCVLSVR